MNHHRLSPIDAAFLHVEDRSNRMQLAGMLVFEGPAPTFAELREAINRRLPALPHFRQRLRRSALGLARPLWVDDDEFDLDYHLHRVALPAPGGHAEIAAMVDHMTAAPLDLRRPLWEITLVEGLAGGGFALALKLHHCMVDGLSIIDICATICSPETRFPSETGPSRPPVRLSRPAAGGGFAEAVRALPRAWKIAGRAPRTRFNSGPSGPARRTEYLTVPLSDVHAVRRAHATTVNNIVLAVVTGALRRYLDRHGELVDTMHAFVPVNRRPEDARGTHGNQIAMTYPALPVGEADPQARVRGVVDAVAAAADAQQADATAALLQLSGYAPQPLAAALNRAMQFNFGMFNLTVTNVPGPPVPVHFLDRKLQLILGATPLTRKHGLTIAVLSYNGGLTFSVTADPRRVPDVADLADDIRAELDLLRGTAAAQTPTHPPVVRSQP